MVFTFKLYSTYCTVRSTFQQSTMSLGLPCLLDLVKLAPKSWALGSPDVPGQGKTAATVPTRGIARGPAGQGGSYKDSWGTKYGMWGRLPLWGYRVKEGTWTRTMQTCSPPPNPIPLQPNDQGSTRDQFDCWRCLSLACIFGCMCCSPESVAFFP